MVSGKLVCKVCGMIGTATQDANDSVSVTLDMQCPHGRQQWLIELGGDSVQLESLVPKPVQAFIAELRDLEPKSVVILEAPRKNDPWQIEIRLWGDSSRELRIQWTEEGFKPLPPSMGDPLASAAEAAARIALKLSRIN